MQLTRKFGPCCSICCTAEVKLPPERGIEVLVAHVDAALGQIGAEGACRPGTTGDPLPVADEGDRCGVGPLHQVGDGGSEGVVVLDRPTGGEEIVGPCPVAAHVVAVGRGVGRTKRSG